MMKGMWRVKNQRCQRKYRAGRTSRWERSADPEASRSSGSEGATAGCREDKAARKAQRQKEAEARERARLGMMQGDERYLTARDRGPQRRFVRDYVDARISIGEFLISAMLVILLMTFLPAQWQIASMLAIWGYLGLSVIDAIFLGMTLKRKLSAKFGADKVQSGFRWYAAMRAFQFRLLRMPKPQVKRFQFPE